MASRSNRKRKQVTADTEESGSGYDSEPRDWMQIFQSTSEVCRPDLYIAPTQMRRNKGRFKFTGLFCHETIQAGQFIGLYTGTFTHTKSVAAHAYALQLANGAVVTPPVDRGKATQPQQHPIPMANEPRPNSRANAFLKEWELDRSDVECVPFSVHDDTFYCAGLVACATIPKHKEIRWSYGSAYAAERKYKVGECCETYPAGTEHPLDILGKVPYTAVTGYIDSPSTTTDEEGDPTYRYRR